MVFPLPDELERLSAVLRREQGTNATADALDTNMGRFRSQWIKSYQMKGRQLPLPVPRNQGLHPNGCQLQASYLDFQFEWKEDAQAPWRAEYQVRVEGYLDAGGALFDLQDHWRLDTDMYAPSRHAAAAGHANPSKEPHPLFHFQRGGHAQDTFAAADFLPANPCSISGIWKGLMQSPGPRIPIVPLDPILAIDFCLSQNDGLVWRRLRNFPEYLDLIETAQRRLWLPFFAQLQDQKFRRTWFGPSMLV
jgi:hypothetical protein